MEEQLPYYEDRQQEAYEDYIDLVKQRDALLSNCLRKDPEINQLRARNAELDAEIEKLSIKHKDSEEYYHDQIRGLEEEIARLRKAL